MYTLRYREYLVIISIACIMIACCCCSVCVRPLTYEGIRSSCSEHKQWQKQSTLLLPCVCVCDPSMLYIGREKFSRQEGIYTRMKNLYILALLPL